jgi:hypothetical protein
MPLVKNGIRQSGSSKLRQRVTVRSAPPNWPALKAEDLTMTTTDPTDLNKAINEVVAASYEMFADHEIDELVARLHRERAEELRAAK